jgi:MFS family permease
MALEGRRLAVVFGLALVFWGAPIVLIASDPQLVGAVVLLAVVGAANSVEDVAVFTLLQRIVPDEQLTRVLGLLWGLAMGAVALGSVAAPVIVDLLGVSAAFALVGAVLPVLALAAYRRLASIDRGVVADPQLALIEQVPMFAPLSVAAKERVASQLVEALVHAGDVVIRTGEPGDRFYVVGEGELDIDAGGAHTTARRGDYFGEIALLRDVPRTATVVAISEAQLFALQREDFLATVTGHPGAQAAGEDVAAARLGRDGVPAMRS